MPVDSPALTFARRVVLVDTRRERRDLMRWMVGGDEAIAIVVGEADSNDGALAIVEDERPDAVVLDVHMPLAAGLAAIRALRARYPRIAIVVCSFDLDRATVARVLAEGADRCLAKPVNRRDIHTALAGLRRDDPSTVGSVCAPATQLHRSAVMAG